MKTVEDIRRMYEDFRLPVDPLRTGQPEWRPLFEPLKGSHFFIRLTSGTGESEGVQHAELEQPV